MPSESAERRTAHGLQMGAAENHHDPLPCPRCDSINTKFCYYNNYNFSQPRHFCKSCRRYWTHGGTLRDIPIGGGSRKSAKRSRTSSLGPTGSQPPLVEPIPSTPVFVSLSSSAGPSPITAVCGGGSVSSFTSLLNSAGPGVLPLGGFGLGLGLEDVGFGLGRGVWAIPPDHQLGIGYGNGNCANGESGGGGGGGGEGNSILRGDTWHVDSGESDFGGGGGGGDCFASLPELAISTPGNAIK